MMDIITLTPENIDQQYICCAMSDKKSIGSVLAKKEWLKCRMEEGLKFKRLDARGKVFIEYIPAENAWVPIIAEGYNFINCFWVSGSFKGHGYGKALLAECEADSLHKNGVAVIVGKKKMPYLSDKAFFIKHGYKVCDSCDPNLELLVKQFDTKSSLPKFKDVAKKGMIAQTRGIDIFYTVQCPFTSTYIKEIEPITQASNFPVRIHQIKSREQAQQHYCPITTYSVFVNGTYFSNEILTSTKLERLISDYE